MKVSYFVFVLFLIFIALVSRFLPFPPNFSPILAVALFAGSRVSKTWVAYAIPFSALFLSDLVLGLHTTMIFVYVPFFAMVALGTWVATKGVGQHLVAGLVGALFFFLVSNFGVWWLSGLYSSNWDGLVQSYALALPFFKNDLLSLGLFGGLLFGAEWAFRQKLQTLPGSSI